MAPRDIEPFRSDSAGADASTDTAFSGRREFLRQSLSGGASLLAGSVLGGCASLAGPFGPADTLIVNGRIATLNRRQPAATALAVKGDTIIGVGDEAGLNHLRGQGTNVIDAGGRAVIPGLNDAHTHFIRGGLTYSIEVRWDGVPSLAEGLRREIGRAHV